MRPGTALPPGPGPVTSDVTAGRPLATTLHLRQLVPGQWRRGTGPPRGGESAGAIVVAGQRLRDVVMTSGNRCCAGGGQLRPEGTRYSRLNLGNPGHSGLTPLRRCGARRRAQPSTRPGLQRRPGHLPAGGVASRSRQGRRGVSADDVYGQRQCRADRDGAAGSVDTGTRSLIPSPTTEWTGAAGLCGGRAVHTAATGRPRWAPTSAMSRIRFTRGPARW